MSEEETGPSAAEDVEALRGIIKRRGQAYIVQRLAAEARERQRLYDPSGSPADQAYHRGWRQDAETLEDAARVLRN